MLNRRVIWLAVVLRIGVYVFLHFSMGIAASGTGLIGKRGGDTAAYFASIDNLLTYGHYTHILNYLPAYAGRMPGYGAVYGLLRLILPQAWVPNTLVILQILLALLALQLLGQLALRLTQSHNAAYAVMLAYAISPFAAQADFIYSQKASLQA